MGVPRLNSTVGGVERRSMSVEVEAPCRPVEPLVAPRRSRPAQTALPLAVRMMQRTSLSRSAFSSSSPNRTSIGPEMVLSRSGRFKVRVAICSETS